MMRRIYLTTITLLFSVATWNAANSVCASGPKFIEVKIDAPYKTFLLSEPALMEFSGAKLIKAKDGKRYILGTATTSMAGKTLDIATRILRVKADRSVLELTNGVQIAVEEILDTKTIVTLVDGKESAAMIEEYKSLITSQVRGKVRSLPVVGSWYSSDKKRFYLAVGITLDGS